MSARDEIMARIAADRAALVAIDDATNAPPPGWGEPYRHADGSVGHMRGGVHLTRRANGVWYAAVSRDGHYVSGPDATSGDSALEALADVLEALTITVEGMRR